LNAAVVTRDDLEAKVIHGLKLLLERDLILFEINVHERTIAHRLAIYLEDQFPAWDVDCEYNRNGYDPKYIKQIDKPRTEDECQKVYPDIIVHRRGTSDNLLAIEMKKNPSKVEKLYDLDKLQEYVDRLGYQGGLFLSFKSRRNWIVLDLVWIGD
jgi:hypothetical protein